MRFTYSLLLDCIDTEHSAASLVGKLTQIGVEACLVDVGVRGGSFVVAQVVEVAAHPGADKLSVCKVFNGRETLQVVCGAPNVRVGMYTVMARIGAVIPKNGMVIERATIRGVDSEGMLCSFDELGISSECKNDGIADLSGYEVGEDFFASHEVIEISVTPNRGDCLGVYGIARELAAAGMGTLKELPVQCIMERTPRYSPISVEMRAGGIFTGRCIESICSSESSPRWIRERLEAAGIRTVSCVVDIINYVTILLNVPIHVYDADKILGGGLVVDKSTAESFSALDGKVYDLCDEDVAVKDSEGNIHCIAGILGSDLSKFSHETRNIFLEAAWYEPVGIVLSSRRLKINTDASYRFSRGTDPGMLSQGLDYATHLITEYCGGVACGIVSSGRMPVEKIVVDFDPNSVRSVGSVAIDNVKIVEVLRALGFTVCEESEAGWKVTVPSWRWNDVTSANDLVEEVLRINGYDQIQEQVVIPVCGAEAVEKGGVVSNRVRASMLAQGLTEVVTLSFLSSAIAEKLGFSVGDLCIENPISNHFDSMRPTILPNLLQVASSNHACGRESVAVFEMGDVYTALDLSEQVVCGVRSGGDVPRNPHTAVRRFDFFDVKSDIESVFRQCGVHSRDLELRATTKAYLHPGKSADIYYKGAFCGYVGELHPGFVGFFELKHPLACFEVFLPRIAVSSSNVNEKKFCVNRFQVVKRDFAFVLDNTTKASAIVSVVEAIRHVVGVSVFDVYAGAGIPEGKVSMAIMVSMTSGVGTMTEAEIREVSDNIVSSVESKLGGQLRLDWVAKLHE